MQVLLATDGSPLDLACARRALPLLSPEAVVTVVVAVRDDRSEDVLTLEEGGSRVLDDILQALDLEASGVVAVGDPADAILQWIDELGADLAVVGSHGYEGFERLLRGSVSEYVVRHAPCPVLVARLSDTEVAAANAADPGSS